MGIADDFAGVLKSVTKELHTEKKRRARNARAAQRTPTYSYRLTIKEAVFDVLPKAIAAASGNGTYPFPARNRVLKRCDKK